MGIIFYPFILKWMNAQSRSPHGYSSPIHPVLLRPKIIEKLQSFQIRGNLIMKSNQNCPYAPSPECMKSPSHALTKKYNWSIIQPKGALHHQMSEKSRLGVTNVLFWPKIIEKLQNFQIRGNSIMKSNQICPFPIHLPEDEWVKIDPYSSPFIHYTLT